MSWRACRNYYVSQFTQDPTRCDHHIALLTKQNPGETEDILTVMSLLTSEIQAETTKIYKRFLNYLTTISLAQETVESSAHILIPTGIILLGIVLIYKYFSSVCSVKSIVPLPTDQSLESLIDEVKRYAELAMRAESLPDTVPIEEYIRLDELYSEAEALLDMRNTIAESLKDLPILSIETVNRVFYNQLTKQSHLNRIAPTLGPVLRAVLHEQLYHPEKSALERRLLALSEDILRDGFNNTFEDLIHAGQIHNGYFDVDSPPSTITLYEVGQSQLRIMHLILENPEHSVILEGLSTCIAASGLPREMKEEVRACFPTGSIPKNFAELTLPQKHCIYKYEGAKTLLALGKITTIYPSSNPGFEHSIHALIDEKISLQKRIYSSILAFLPRADKINFNYCCLLELANGSKIYRDLREVIALKEAFLATKGGKGILVYGNGHNFIEWYASIRYIPTDKIQNDNFIKYMEKEDLIRCVEHAEKVVIATNRDPAYLLNSMLEHDNYLERTSLSQLASGVFVYPPKVVSFEDVSQINEPVLFHSNQARDIVFKSSDLTFLSYHDITRRFGFGEFLFAINQDGKLLVADRELKEPVLRDGYEDPWLRHPEMVDEAPVLAAGTLLTHNGFQIIAITNQTGHYYCGGAHLKGLIEDAFQQFGFKEEALNKYNDVRVSGKTPTKSEAIISCLSTNPPQLSQDELLTRFTENESTQAVISNRAVSAIEASRSAVPNATLRNLPVSTTTSEASVHIRPEVIPITEKIKLVREGASLQSKLATERLTDLQRRQCNARLTEIHDEIKRLNRSEIEIIHPNEKFRKLIWSIRAVRLVTENVVLNTSHAVAKDAVAHFLERAGMSSDVSEVVVPAAGVAAEVGVARVIFGAGGPSLVVMALLSTVDEAANYMDRHPAETPFGQLSQAAVQVTRDIVHTVFSPLAGATQGMITACQQETIPYESCYSLDDGTTTIPPDLAKKIVNHVLHGIIGAVGESIERLQQDGLKFINATLKIEVNSFDAGGGELVFCPESLTIDPIAKTNQPVSASTKQTAESLVGPLPATNPLANRPAPPSILSQIRYESTIDPFSVKPIFESAYWAHREQLLKPYVMSLLEDNRRDRALNPFVSDDNIPLAQRFLLSTTNMFNPFRSHQIDVHAKVRAAWAIVRHSLRPDARQMYDELQGQLRMEAFVHGQSFGLGYQLSFIDFAAILRNECLVTSYNSFSPYTIRSYAMKFLHDIGGVASRVGLIDDLINSDFQARAELDGVTYCYPVSPFFDETVDLVELCNQMQTIHLKEKDRAFVSIHFNREGEIFTVIPPILKGTLIERVVVLLDYWMKGFLNGGIFDEQFILNWHKTANHDETYLREHLIDLKRYCRNDAQAKQLQLAYYSLREAMSRFHANEHAHSVNISEKQPYQTSFRIIARLGEMQRHDHMMFPKPEYDIEYTIEETEAYKQFLEQHKARHGHYPDDYEAMKQCTHDFATEVKNTFLKLPFLQNYLDLLGLATVSGYIDLTLDAMGKEVVFKNKPMRLHEPFPEILPPIPVQYFKRLPLKITLQDCLEHLPAEEVNTHLQSLFQEIPMSQFPQLLKPVIQHAIEGLLLEKIQQHLQNTTPVELNDYEIIRMVMTLSMHLVACCHDIDRINREQIKEVLYFLTKSELELFDVIPVFEQVERAKAEVDRFIEGLIENKILTDEQTIESMPEETRVQVRTMLAQLEREIRQSLESSNALIDKRIAENTALVNKLRGDISTCRQNISSANAELQRFNHQVAQLSAHEEMMNRDTIRNARQSTATNIASWNKAITDREEAIKAIDLENKALQEKKSNNLSSLPEMLKKAHKEELKLILQSIKDNLLAQLDEIKQKLEHPHGVMLNAMRQATLPFYLTEHYIHMRRGFTNKDLIRETGDTFEIMGGCSIALPNIETSPLAEENALLGRVSELHVQNEQVQYVMQGTQKYAVFHLPIRPKKELKVEPTEAQQYLEALMSKDIEQMPLDLNQLKKSVDEQGAYVMHYVSTGLSLPKIQKLMDVDRAQVKLADDFGFLPIHVAAHEGRVDLVSYFLDIEPSLLNAKSKKGITPLSIAVQVGHIEVLRVLLSRGANPHMMLHNGLFPLHNSIENHFPEIALLLLQYLTAEQASQPMESGMTPLHLAIRQELDTVAIALIQKGVCLTATLKANGYTPFHMAIEQGNEKLVEAMILPYPALSKLTQAEFQQLKTYFSTYKYIKDGETTTTPYTTHQVSEFKRILKYWSGNTFEKKFLEHPLLSFKLPSGDSVLHVAANAGEVAQKVVQLLIKYGAVSDVENALNETPLTRALMSRAQYTMISALSTTTPKRVRHEKPFLSLAIETNQLNWVQCRAFRTCQQEVMPSDGLALATRYNNLWTAIKFHPIKQF